MPIPFNIPNSDTEEGLVQLYEDEIGAKRGDVSGNATLLNKFKAQVNSALGDFWTIALPAAGTWQLDDANQSDDPTATTALVANQRDYRFNTDGSGNSMLEVYRVFVANASGIFTEIFPVDVQSQSSTSTFTDGQNGTGTPTRYDKTADGIFLDPVPSYSLAGGLKVYFSRTPSYFASTDTTKKAGIPALFHKYLYLKPAFAYARRNSSANFNALKEIVEEMEGDEARGLEGSIASYYARRSRDEKPGIRVAFQDNH